MQYQSQRILRQVNPGAAGGIGSGAAAPGLSRLALLADAVAGTKAIKHGATHQTSAGLSLVPVVDIGVARAYLRYYRHSMVYGKVLKIINILI